MRKRLKLYGFTSAFLTVLFSFDFPNYDFPSFLYKSQEILIGGVPFGIVDLSPALHGCDLFNNMEIKKCAIGKIDAYLYTNFNRFLLKRSDRKVGIHFQITSTGTLDLLQSGTLQKHLEAKIIRIVSAMPNFTIGEKRVQKLGVLYGGLLDFSSKKFKKVKNRSKRNKS